MSSQLRLVRAELELDGDICPSGMIGIQCLAAVRASMVDR